jgi:DNA modification methylase
MQLGLCNAVLYTADCRRMPELATESIDLVVTSPPYGQIKNYGSPGQIGFGQTLQDYLRDLQHLVGVFPCASRGTADCA